jgi:phenylacetate-coenzyme A ligase PaaK-like adenylate-forming protein
MNKEIKNFYNSIFSLKPYSLNRKEKLSLFSKGMNILTKFHFKKNYEYRSILKKNNYVKKKNLTLENLPFLPVSIFKNFTLVTSDIKKIERIAKSSGTTGSKVSKIYLDRENSINQVRVLNKILLDYFGNKKGSMLVMLPEIKNARTKDINAKMAAVKGFSILANKIYYSMKNKKIDMKVIKSFLNDRNKQKFIFGFTNDIWKHLHLEISKKNEKLNFKNVILIHGGGWKKFEKDSISNKEYKRILIKNYNFKKVLNYYGMIEQTGSIFLECNVCNSFISSNYSDIFSRDKNFNVIENKPGLVQLLSLLPTSYPGHNIITEDIGEIVNIRCKECSKKNFKQFIIHGRVKNSEIRGCSNI